MLRSFFFLVLYICVNSLYAQTADVKVITLGANEAPPYWSKKMKHNGMAGEIIQAISEVQNTPVNIVFKPLSRLIRDDANNDLGNPEFFIPYQDFADIITIALYHTSFYFYEYNHKNNTITGAHHNHSKYEFKSFEELRGKKVGLIKGALVDKSAFEPYGIIFETSYSQESLFKKLKLGRLDYVLAINLVAQGVIQDNFSNEVEDFIPIHLKGFSSPISIMIAQEQEDAHIYAKKFREGLKSIILNGRYEKIVKKYYEAEILPSNWFEEMKRFNQLYKIGEDN